MMYCLSVGRDTPSPRSIQGNIRLTLYSSQLVEACLRKYLRQI